MAFIRVKRIRGREYAYLVASRWDSEARTSRQETIKYLGPVDEVRIEDVPSDYRTDRVTGFVLRRSAALESRRSRVATSMTERLVRALLRGERRKVDAVSEDAQGALGLEAFYIDVVTPAMHEIGDKWEAGEISPSEEHLASNLMLAVVGRMNDEIPAPLRPIGTAALCVPQGEMHRLPVDVLEGLLRQRGYRCYNIAGSAPTDSVLSFLAREEPDAVIISLTIREYLPAARRLARAVRTALPDAKVLVGGQGLPRGSGNGFPADVRVFHDGAREALEILSKKHVRH